MLSLVVDQTAFAGEWVTGCRRNEHPTFRLKENECVCIIWILLLRPAERLQVARDRRVLQTSN
jgi:hypothetical protein